MWDGFSTRPRPRSGRPSGGGRVENPSHIGNRRVVLWPDTFNNHFHPDTALAAADVLESLGYHVTLPRKTLCCGRPLYDWGFLSMAKDLLRETMETLKPELDEGLPIIVLEPSCASVFRDELSNLFPGHEDARRLREATMTLSEFIVHEKIDVPQLRRKALVDRKSVV